MRESRVSGTSFATEILDHPLTDSLVAVAILSQRNQINVTLLMWDCSLYVGSGTGARRRERREAKVRSQLSQKPGNYSSTHPLNLHSSSQADTEAARRTEIARRENFIWEKGEDGVVEGREGREGHLVLTLSYKVSSVATAWNNNKRTHERRALIIRFQFDRTRQEIEKKDPKKEKKSEKEKV